MPFFISREGVCALSFEKEAPAAARAAAAARVALFVFFVPSARAPTA
jgi:hypothetical protein